MTFDKDIKVTSDMITNLIFRIANIERRYDPGFVINGNLVSGSTTAGAPNVGGNLCIYTGHPTDIISENGLAVEDFTNPIDVSPP